jgi:hypothetical protein
MASASNKSILGASLFIFIVSYLSLGLPIARIESPDFRIDEAEYITLGVHSVRQALGKTDASAGGQLGDQVYSHPWRQGIHESTFGFQSPGLPKLIFGSLGIVSGVEQIDVKLFPRFGTQTTAKGVLKTERTRAKALVKPALDSAREVTRLWAALVAALLFGIASSVAAGWSGSKLHYFCGALAAILWISSPVVWEASAHVRPGLLPVVFWCTALLVVLMARQLPVLAIAALLGLCCGMATAGKLNGVLLAPLIPYFLFNVQRARGIEKIAALGSALAGTLLAGLLSFGVFLALAPGLWHDTIAGVASIVELWNGDLASQAKINPKSIEISTGAMHSIGMGLRGLVSSQGPLAGFIPYLGILLLPLGLAALSRGSRARSEASGQHFVDRNVLAWSLLLLFASAYLVPMDRPRYMLPMVAPVALVEALLLARLIGFALHRKQRTAVQDHE